MFLNVFEKQGKWKIGLDWGELVVWLVHVNARDRVISMTDAQGPVDVTQVS